MMRALFCCALGVFSFIQAAHADITIPFQTPQSGRVSLAIYNGEGQLVRTLLTGKPLPSGQHSATWDGLDRYGNALPAGEYSWKLLATAGLRAEFLMQVGQNTIPTWEKATGNHTAPNAVAVDASGLYRIGAENEGAHWGVKTDWNGRHLWVNNRWSVDPWVQKTASLTLVGERLFELLPSGEAYGYNAQSGRVFTSGDFDPRPWNLRWNGFEPPKNIGDEQRRKLNAAQAPRDFAGDAKNDCIVAAFPQHDAVAWFSARDGKWLDSAAGLSKLAGVAAQGGVVYAIVSGAVVQFTREDKTPRVLIAADKLQNPWRLCVSGVSGEIFVAENSALAGGNASGENAPRHHQVKRFSPGGVLLKSFGTPQGRGDGVYVPTDFRGITDIEADAQGGFVVTEGQHTPPRRSARFDAGGKPLREWFGAQHYGSIACPEPDNPRYVWSLANAPQPGLVRWEVDYAAKTWRVAEIYQDAFAANRFFGGDSSHGSVVPTVFARGGLLYIYNGGLSSLKLCVYDRKTKRMRPSNASSGADGKAVFWNDLNDDGLVSDGEIEQLSRNVVGGYIDPGDLGLRTTPFGTRFQAGQFFKPLRFTAGGTPVYAGAQMTGVEPWRENGRTHQPLDFRRASDGGWYGSISDAASNPNEGNETHGAWYYNSNSAIDRLVKWDKNGKPLWSVGRHSPDNDHETGSTAMARGLVGLVRDCVVWGDASDEELARPTVWTQDGLYVDELLRVPLDNVPKYKHGVDNAYEYPTGHIVTDARSGEIYFYALNSGGGAPVYRISGWDDWHRAGGKITLAQAATAIAKRDGTGLKGEYFNNANCEGEAALTRKDKVLFFNWGEGGQSGVPDKSITAEIFSVRWSGTYEAATSEEVRFEIRGSFPWRAKGQPLWARLWLGGELLFDSKPRGAGGSTFDEQARSSLGTVRVKLRAGERVALRLEAAFKKGEAAIALNHDTPGLDRRAVMPPFLHPEPGPLKKLAIATETRPPLLADFGFEEKSGALSRSRTGGDVFGRLTGTARRVPGKVGQGIELTGRGLFDPATFPIDEELRLPAGDYTVAFWFKTASPDVRLCEAKRYTSYNNNWSDHVVSLENGMLRFALRGDEALLGKEKLNDNQWHYVVTSVGPGGQRLFVDGKLLGTGKLAARTLTSNRLGLDLGPGESEGSVAFDELRVWSRALTPDEALNPKTH